VEKYNLDDKGGLFKFIAKSPSKIVKQGDGIELKHFGMFNYIKSKVSEVTETSIRVQSSEKSGDTGISPGDHVVLYYSSGDIYVVTGSVGTVNKLDPIDLTVKVVKIEKLKDMVKEKKHCISLNSSFKIIGVPDSKPAVATNVSFGGIKANCREDIMLEDIVEVTIYVDKNNRIQFKGRIVRKNKVGDINEYGIEFSEMTESNNKLMTRLMYEIDGKL
jgi:hypothetical protein